MCLLVNEKLVYVLGQPSNDAPPTSPRFEKNEFLFHEDRQYTCVWNIALYGNIALSV